MASKKDLAIVVLITFSVTAMLFMIIPSHSLSDANAYNPLLDVNNDGVIDFRDISAVARAFGASGTPTNKTVGTNANVDLTARRARYSTRVASR